MMAIENEHFNCMKTVSCKVTSIENDDNRKLGGVGLLGCQGYIGGLTETVGTQGPEGIWGNQGVLGGSRGCRGYFGGVRGCQRCTGGLVGTLGTQKPEGYRGIRGYWEVLGV